MTNNFATNNYTIRPAWTPLTICMMIFGFIIWWPLGLAMIAYILWGNQFQGPFDNAQHGFKAAERKFRAAARDSKWRERGPFANTDNDRPTTNMAFNTYRAKEINRLQEEHKRLDDEVREFEEFLANLRHARDKREFDNYMNARQKKRDEEKRRDEKRRRDTRDIIET